MPLEPDLTQLLKKLTPIRSGKSMRDVLSVERISAIQDCLWALAAGMNIRTDGNIRKASGPCSVLLRGATQAEQQAAAARVPSLTMIPLPPDEDFPNTARLLITPGYFAGHVADTDMLTDAGCILHLESDTLDDDDLTIPYVKVNMARDEGTGLWSPTSVEDEYCLIENADVLPDQTNDAAYVALGTVRVDDDGTPDAMATVLAIAMNGSQAFRREGPALDPVAFIQDHWRVGI